jgi:hypothetical protein
MRENSHSVCLFPGLRWITELPTGRLVAAIHALEKQPAALSSKKRVVATQTAESFPDPCHESPQQLLQRSRADRVSNL